MARNKPANNPKHSAGKPQHKPKQGRPQKAPQQRSKAPLGVNKRADTKRAASETLATLGGDFLAEAVADLSERGIKVKTAKERRRAEGGAAKPASASVEPPSAVFTPPAAAAPPPLDPSTLLSGWSIK